MLVAPKVNDYHDLGIMLGLDYKRVKMFENERRGNTVLINMEILTTWISEETEMPTTWHTLIQALCDMDMKKLAHDISKKLEQKAEPK